MDVLHDEIDGITLQTQLQTMPAAGRDAERGERVAMHICRVWAAVLGSLALLGVVVTPNPYPRPERAPVLDHNVVPIAYDLTIAPKRWTWHGGKADGDEKIVVDVRKPTREILLNAYEITVTSARIDGVRARSKSYPIAQQMAFSTGAEIAPGRHTLHLRFVGNILADAAGLWPDNFTNPPAPNLVAFFEPSRARTLFPCFDEPRFRTTFRVRVVAPSAWKVISNMPLTRKAALAGHAEKSMFTFARTPPIPTYLLTLDMGDFAAVHGAVGKTPVTVYIRPGQGTLGHAVLTNAEQSLAFYSRYFGVAYPMPKLDVVVASGVLNDTEEGLGAVTIYTEYDVSGKQMGGGLSGRETAFAYVAQPIAQQWFGGLAGIRSWGESWLTNGLASWAESRAEAHLHPGFAAIPQDIDWPWNAISLWGSLAPLRHPFADDRDPASFNSLMAGGTDSGEAVLNQWNAYVGNAQMRAAVHRYLIANAWKAVTDADFWSSFGTRAAAHYGKVWLNEPGAPVVSERTACEAGRQVVRLSQMPVRSAYLRDRRGTIWPVPISITARGTTTWTMLGGRSTRVPLGSCGAPVVIDMGLRPPYPVREDLATLDGLAHDDSLQAIDRTRILRDTSVLYHSGVATLPELLAAIRIDPGYPSGRASFNDLDFALAKAAAALEGSRYETMFASSIERSLVPALRRAGFSPRQSSENGLNLAYNVMSYLPSSTLTREALDAWRASRSTGSTFGFLSFGFLRYAGSAGSWDDVRWALKHVSEHPTILLPGDPIYFLAGVRNPRLVGRILASLSARRVDYPEIVWEIGKREPAIVSPYLERHVHDIMRVVPPSQQAATLAFGIARGPWAARSPAQWRQFLLRTLPRRDEPTVHAAMLIIDKNWALRHRLEAELERSPSR